MKRLATSLAAVAVLAIPATATASTSPAPAGAHPYLFGTCVPGAGVTYGGGKIIRLKKPIPDGFVNNILATELFVIQCPPISGSLTIELQYRVGTTWTKATDARYDFPAPSGTKGFGLQAGPYYCQGSKTSWRLAIFSSGVSADGSKWGPATNWDPAMGGDSGLYFDCTK